MALQPKMSKDLFWIAALSRDMSPHLISWLNMAAIANRESERGIKNKY